LARPEELRSVCSSPIFRSAMGRMTSICSPAFLKWRRPPSVRCSQTRHRACWGSIHTPTSTASSTSSGIRQAPRS
jgi:hypothetical protein